MKECQPGNATCKARSAACVSDLTEIICEKRGPRCRDTELFDDAGTFWRCTVAARRFACRSCRMVRLYLSPRRFFVGTDVSVQEVQSSGDCCCHFNVPSSVMRQRSQ